MGPSKASRWLTLSLLLVLAILSRADELDIHGYSEKTPSAYLHRDFARQEFVIYTWDGIPAAYLEEKSVYRFTGEHIGWTEGFLIFNHEGYVVGALVEAQPDNPPKGFKQLRPAKAAKKPWAGPKPQFREIASDTEFITWLLAPTISGADELSTSIHDVARFREWMSNSITLEARKGQSLDPRWTALLQLSDEELSQFVERRRKSLLGRHYFPARETLTASDRQLIDTYKKSQYAELVRKTQQNLPMNLGERADYWILMASNDYQLASYLRERQRQHVDKILRGDS